MSNKYNSIRTIRYMGNKLKLLNFIIPEIEKITKKGDIICDLMSGTCSVSYALKERNPIYTNDIQFYSYIIGKGLIENNNVKLSKEDIEKDIIKKIEVNRKKHYNTYFVDNFTDTYFSGKQCEEIDNIRYAIEKVENNYKQDLYLICLMYAMSKCESTTGHFAQFLPKDHKRVIPLRKKSILKEFLDKANELKDLKFSKFKNKSFNLDYKEFFKTKEFNDVECFYIDTPYTGEQYSRFYHVLETICKNDKPELEFKGKYRKDRYMSDFSLKANVKEEFKYMLSYLSENNKKVVLSYSNKALVPIDELEFIFSKIFKNVKLLKTNYEHSSQGKGSAKLDEVIIIAYN